MALSPQDRKFYDSKLNWNGFVTLLVTTVICGAILVPAFLYVQDYEAHTTGGWSVATAGRLAFVGMILGSVLSALMFGLARFYLWMGWLPRRR